MATNRASRRVAPKTSKPTTVRVVIEGKPYEAPVFMRAWLLKGAEAYRAAREQGLTQTFEEFLESMSAAPENALALAKQAAAFS